MIKRLKDFCKSEDLVNNLKNVLVVFAYVVIVIALMSRFAFAEVRGSSSYDRSYKILEVDDDDDDDDDDDGDGGDGIEATIDDGMAKIQGLMFKFSTGAVVIAVGCGVFIKKFSMGKQDKIELGNKLIRDSIIGFIVLNAMPIIATTIQNFLKDEGGAEATSIIEQYFRNFM